MTCGSIVDLNPERSLTLADGVVDPAVAQSYSERMQHTLVRSAHSRREFVMDGVGTLTRPHWLSGGSTASTESGRDLTFSQPAFVGLQARESDTVIGSLVERRGMVLAADGSWNGREFVLSPTSRSMETFRLEFHDGLSATLSVSLKWKGEAGGAQADLEQIDPGVLLFGLWAAKILRVKWAGLSQAQEYRVLEPVLQA